MSKMVGKSSNARTKRRSLSLYRPFGDTEDRLPISIYKCKHIHVCMCVSIHTLNHHNNIMWQVLLLCSFQDEKMKTQRSDNLSRVTQLVHGTARN